MLSIKLIKISIVLLFVTTTSGCAVMGDALKFMAEVGECYAGVDCVQDNGGFDGVTSDNGSSAAFVQSSIIDNSYRTSAPLSTRSLNTGSTSNRKNALQILAQAQLAILDQQGSAAVFQGMEEAAAPSNK